MSDQCARYGVAASRDCAHNCALSAARQVGTTTPCMELGSGSIWNWEELENSLPGR